MIAFIREFAEAGTLLTYGVNLSEFVGRSAPALEQRAAAGGDGGDQKSGGQGLTHVR